MWVMFDTDLEEGSLETYHQIKSFVWQTMIDRAIAHEDELAEEYRGYIKNGYENFELSQVKYELECWNYQIYLLDTVQFNNVTCLNCGIIQIPKKIFNDEDGTFVQCYGCKSTFDIPCRKEITQLRK